MILMTRILIEALQYVNFRHKKRRFFLLSVLIYMVPKAGLEPAHPKAVDFESTASTDFATSALKWFGERGPLYLSEAHSQHLSFRFCSSAEKRIAYSVFSPDLSP